MTSLFPRETYLDGERCWREWHKVGSSLKKVAKLLEVDGGVNPQTARKFTPTAIRHAAWRWALENTEKAYEVAKFRSETEGRFLDEETWKKALAEGARFRYNQSPKQYAKYIREHGLQEYAK